MTQAHRQGKRTHRVRMPWRSLMRDEFRHVIQTAGVPAGTSCTLVCRVEAGRIELLPYGSPECGARLSAGQARELAQALLEAAGETPSFTNAEGRQLARKLLRVCGEEDSA